MNYQFIDIPKFIPAESYHAAIERMVKKLLDTEQVKGVYQVGGITSPGISDIDLFVVFKNDISSHFNPVRDLSYPDNYLFTHRLFGTCEKFAVQLEQFTFFSKYNFLGGTPTLLLNYKATLSETEQLKHQIALEYLIKGWYSNAIGMQFGSVKLRNLLLHAKAILLDLDFLGIKDGNLIKCIHEIMEVRANWFQKPASAKTLTYLINQYDKELMVSISQCVARYSFYMPEGANFRLSKRIKLVPAQHLFLQRSGLRIPNTLTRLSDKFLKIQNRITEFSVGVPVTTTSIPGIIKERHQVLQEAFAYNHKNLPGFLCTGHGMNLFYDETSRNSA